MEATIVGFQCPTRMTQPNIDPAPRCSPSQTRLSGMEDHEQQAHQDSGTGSSDHHHADERPGHGHRERQTRGRYPRGPDPEGSGLSHSAIHPAQGRRYDATATDLASDVLSLQGRVRLLQHPAGGERSVNAVWTYEAPYAAVSAIREYLAFYPDRVDAIKV